MWEDVKSWLRDDYTNNLLALLSLFVALIPYLLSVLCKIDFGEGGLMFSVAQVLFTLSALIVISYRYSSYTLKELSSENALKDYIECECLFKQTTDNTSFQACRIVKTTLEQFFTMWKFIWMAWMMYYIVEVFYWTPLLDRSNYVHVAIVSGIMNLFDFWGSASMLALYVVLNDYTVDRRVRARSFNSAMFITGIVSCVVFVFCLLFFTKYVSDPQGNLNFALYCRVVLSTFGCISFVLVLGKFNSHYLQIPRLMIMPLYIYAVVQAFSFLVGDLESTEGGILFAPLTEIANRVVPWITIIGKIALLVALSWILNNKRIIFFIVRRSLSMTEVKEQLIEFNRYME